MDVLLKLNVPQKTHVLGTFCFVITFYNLDFCLKHSLKLLFDIGITDICKECLLTSVVSIHLHKVSFQLLTISTRF